MTNGRAFLAQLENRFPSAHGMGRRFDGLAHDLHPFALAQLGRFDRVAQSFECLQPPLHLHRFSRVAAANSCLQRVQPGLLAQGELRPLIVWATAKSSDEALVRLHRPRQPELARHRRVRVAAIAQLEHLLVDVAPVGRPTVPVLALALTILTRPSVPRRS